MEKTVDLIPGAAKTLFSYCRARTYSREDAEDLSQEILLVLLKTHRNLRNDEAFYGFMWAIAGNVYKNWCKKRTRNATVELQENVPDNAVTFVERLENETDVRLLYRELSLLTEQYRRVTVLYYFEGLKISEISASEGTSESMAKFLLFKSRRALREGMNMERARGDLSFNPGSLQLRYWGKGSNPFWKLCEDSLIAQNILLTCYNDRCTAEEISVQIGVAVPYLEKDLKALCEKDVLLQKGGRYETAVVIFTKEFAVEADAKTLEAQRGIAGLIGRFIDEHISEVKALGLNWGDVDEGLLRWHLAALILEKAVLGKYQGSLRIEYPKKYAGCEAFVWGEEDYKSRYGGFGTCGLKNADEDLMRFLDFSINGEMDHHYFFNYPNRVNIALAVPNGKTDAFSQNDRMEVAELIRNGFVNKSGDNLSLNLPVFTGEEFKRLLSLMDSVMNEVAEKTREMIGITTDILIQHTPVSMKKEAEAIGWLKMFDNAMTAPIRIMLDQGMLRQVADNEHPTAYIVLK